MELPPTKAEAKAETKAKLLTKLILRTTRNHIVDQASPSSSSPSSSFRFFSLGLSPGEAGWKATEVRQRGSLEAPRHAGRHTLPRPPMLGVCKAQGLRAAGAGGREPFGAANR